MSNIVDLKEHITSKNIRNIFEDANTVFMANSDNISNVILPNYIQFSDFPYDEDIYNKLKEKKKYWYSTISLWFVIRILV